MYFKSFFIVLCILNTPLQAARILSIFAYPSPAQYAFIEPLLKQLASRGHQITSISNYPQSKPLKNFRDIVIEENKHLYDGYQNLSWDRIEDNHFDRISVFYKKAFQMCLNIFNNPTVQNIFQMEKFDLIILEVCFTESFFGLSELLQAPIVGVSAWGTMISMDELVGNTSPTSFVPSMCLPLSKMNFWQRFLNVVINTLQWSYYNLKYMPVQKKIYEKFFPSAHLSFAEAQKNFALVLVNDHFTLSAPRPYVPNMIEVAGLHIDTKPQPIPSSIKEILDNATEGVILIETHSSISYKVVDIFLQQFKTLNQIILWQTKQDIVSPASNIFVNANFSQSAILSHPNVKLLISQHGFLAAIESVYYGIPILCLAPNEYMDDYFDYVKRIGNGLTLKLYRISKQNFGKTLNELLNNSHYTNNAKLLSKRFRDQQSTPMERAIYWIEYVLRHDGAEYLRNMGRLLTWYQFYNMDVLILLIHIIVILLFLPYFIIKIIIKCFSNPKYKAN